MFVRFGRQIAPISCICCDVDPGFLYILSALSTLVLLSVHLAWHLKVQTKTFFIYQHQLFALLTTCLKKSVENEQVSLHGNECKIVSIICISSLLPRVAQKAQKSTLKITLHYSISLITSVPFLSFGPFL